jgi:hypothetical protein
VGAAVVAVPEQVERQQRDDDLNADGQAGERPEAVGRHHCGGGENGEGLGEPLGDDGEDDEGQISAEEALLGHAPLGSERVAPLHDHGHDDGDDRQ